MRKRSFIQAEGSIKLGIMWLVLGKLLIRMTAVPIHLTTLRRQRNDVKVEICVYDSANDML